MKQNFFVEYYQELRIAYESESPSIKYNSDRAHNAVIMCFMFDHSNIVNMYCGQMSVLRTGFFEKINEQNEFSDPHLGDELRACLKKSLDNFMMRESTKLNILFESYSESYAQDMVSPETMRKSEECKKLSMKVLSESLMQRKDLDHFTVSDAGIYRFEDDKDQHSAICSFNNEKNTSKLQQNFNILYNLEGNYNVSLC